MPTAVGRDVQQVRSRRHLPWAPLHAVPGRIQSPALDEKTSRWVVRVRLTAADEEILQQLTRERLDRLHELAAVLDEFATAHNGDTAFTS